MTHLVSCPASLLLCHSFRIFCHSYSVCPSRGKQTNEQEGNRKENALPSSSSSSSQDCFDAHHHHRQQWVPRDAKDTFLTSLFHSFQKRRHAVSRESEGNRGHSKETSTRDRVLWGIKREEGLTTFRDKCSNERTRLSSLVSFVEKWKEDRKRQVTRTKSSVAKITSLKMRGTRDMD